MIGVYDYTVIATYLSLLLGLAGIYSAAQNAPLAAMLYLMLAGLLDAFDGRIARTKANRTDAEKRFGIQIDSLNDLVCFGVLPAAIGWSTGCKNFWFMAAMSFFALCALIRLAYFLRPCGAAFLSCRAVFPPELRSGLCAGTFSARRAVHHAPAREKAAPWRHSSARRAGACRICRPRLRADTIVCLPTA